MNDFQFIDSNEELENACQIINKSEIIALDTEFVRDFSYIPKLCLIQICADNKIYLIDSLNCDISPLIKILTDESITKLMHAASQDCDIFYKNFQIIPKPIFDTQIAASIIGIGDNISYQKLVKKYAHKNLNKDTKLTNWVKRPLLARQLSYAADDVRYLHQLKAILEQKLSYYNRTSWMQEESEYLYNTNNYCTDPSNAWQKISQTNKRPFFLNYLKHYAAIRENICKQNDKLKRNVISDDLLMELARSQPKCEDDIKQHRLLANKIDKKLWPEILKVAATITQNNEGEIPSAKSYVLNHHQETICSLLKLLLQDIAAKNSISPRIIATTDEIKKFVKTGESVRFMQGERYEIFGQYAKELMDGKLSIAIKDGQLQITKVCV